MTARWWVLLCLLAPAAHGAELRLLSAIGMQVVMEELAPKFQRASGHRLAMTFANLGTAVKRVQAGESFDVALAVHPGIEGFVKNGKADARTVSLVARSGVGLAVRKGAAKRDISTPESLRRTLLEARSVVYADPASGSPGGGHFAGVLERLGIAAEIKAKTVHPRIPDPLPPGTIGRMVANGEAELGVNQIQEFVSIPGIEVLGPLPEDLQLNIVFAAAVMSGARDAGASRRLIDFLRSPEAAAAIRARGMEPAAP
jgi:molybdate transport system substrate-binding protein